MMETTEQFWWKTRARGEHADNTSQAGVRGREHPFGLREERMTKKNVRRCETSTSTDIFGRKVEGRRASREGSRSRCRREESSSTCTPVSSCRSSKEEQEEGAHRRVHRRKEESGNQQGEKNRSEEEKRRRVSQMKEGDLDVKEKRKELEEEEEETIMAQAHSLLLTMDSMLSLEGKTLLQNQLKLKQSYDISTVRLKNCTKPESQSWLVQPASAPG